MELKLSRRVALGYLLLESPFALLLSVGWCALLSLDIASSVGSALAWFGLTRVMAALYLQRELGPVDRWREGAPGDEAALVEAELVLRRAPARFMVANGGLWLLSYLGLTLQLWFAQPASAALLGPAELGVVLLFLLANLGGSGAFAIPVISMLSSGERAALSQAFAVHGLEAPAHTRSLRLRLSVLIAVFVLTPTALVAAATQSSKASFDRYRAAVELGARAQAELERVRAGIEPEHGRLVPLDGFSPGAASAAIEELPESEATIEIDRRRQHVRLALPIQRGPGAGSWLMLEAPVERSRSVHSQRLVVVCLLLSLWALAMAWMIPRSLILPLIVLARAMKRLIEVGDILDLEHLPVVQDDELGAVVRSFNGLTSNLRELTFAAQAVAKGDLAVGLEQAGDLSGAFRAMLAQLQVMVGQISATAEEVARASAEILAAVQGQELAGIEHAEQVHAVSERVASLAELAAEISLSASEVQDNASHSLTTTATVSARIVELSAHAQGIGALLDQIREVASRSDLLALNGSLEATRAGEAGRGFALVAVEMRRLAERVTGTVADVSARLADIDRSSATTVAATTDSRRFAEHTVGAAEQISALTKEQRADTAHVAETMQAMAHFVASASASNTQTRAATEGLRGRVAQLDQLTRSFELGPAELER